MALTPVQADVCGTEERGVRGRPRGAFQQRHMTASPSAETAGAPHMRQPGMGRTPHMTARSPSEESAHLPCA